MACTPKPHRRVLKAADTVRRRGGWAVVLRDKGRLRLCVVRAILSICR